MEILIGLAIATALVYGWFRGFVLVAIFLTMGECFLLLMFQTGAGLASMEPSMVLGLALALVIIWTPIAIQRH